MARILLVEDSRMLRKMLVGFLTAWGHEAVPAEHGKDALEKIREHDEAELPIELVITDLFMPEMDGFELMERLLEDHPKLRFLVMSGRQDKADSWALPSAKYLGAYASLKKPVGPSTLLEAVREALEGRRVRR